MTENPCSRLRPDSLRSLEQRIRACQKKSGLFSDDPASAESLQSTLSALKLFCFLETSCPDPDRICGNILSGFDQARGLFLDVATHAPSFPANALSLMILQGVGAEHEVRKLGLSTARYLDSIAATKEEHFITAAVVDECKVPFFPEKTVAFFRRQEPLVQRPALEQAIAAASLMRCGATLVNAEVTRESLLRSHNPVSGAYESAGTDPLWSSYCIVRALDLLAAVEPSPVSLGWLDSQPLETMNRSYQVLAVLSWIIGPLFRDAAGGNGDRIERWLHAGGTPAVQDPGGFTLLMRAAAHGNEAVASRLIDVLDAAVLANKQAGADGDALFFAAQSGSLPLMRSMVRKRPDLLLAHSRVNGHTPLLQLAFFGSQRHLACAEWILTEGAGLLDSNAEAVQTSLVSAVNVRGYTPRTMSQLWGNEPMERLLARYDHESPALAEENLNRLLNEIRLFDGAPDGDDQQQLVTDRVIDDLGHAFREIDEHTTQERANGVRDSLFSRIGVALESPLFSINRRGGPLRQTPIIVAVTGVDQTAVQKRFRVDLVRFLLDHGADPDLPERHPMAVDAVIRAAVLNHFEILQLFPGYMKPLAFKAALNERPAINGQTALQDSVHRALTAPEHEAQSHRDQIVWMLEHGADPTIEDFTGKSPRKLAEYALTDTIYRARARELVTLLKTGGDQDPPTREEP